MCSLLELLLDVEACAMTKCEIRISLSIIFCASNKVITMSDNKNINLYWSSSLSQK